MNRMLRSTRKTIVALAVASAASVALAAPAPSAVTTADALPARAFLGVEATPIAPADVGRLGVRVGEGVVVGRAFEGGSAEAAGLRRDDVIVAVGDATVTDPGALVRALGGRRSGERVTIRYVRDGAPQSVTVVLRPRPQESSPDALTRYDSVRVGDALRRTITTAPRDDARHPGVLYMTGIGCFSQESLPLNSTEAQLLYALTHAGYVTMRVEKSGVGDSQGTPCDSPAVGLHAEVDGYLAGLAALKRDPRVDPRNVFLLGLSIGGVDAPLVAQREPVQGIVVVNTLAKPFFEYLLETRRRQGLLKGTMPIELERDLRTNEACNHDLLIERKTPEAVVARNAECAHYLQYAAPYTYMQEWAALDLPQVWNASKAPVLVVQGESDFVATVADAPYLTDTLNRMQPGRASLRMIPSMDHTLTRAASMQESFADASPRPFATAIVAPIVEWLDAHRVNPTAPAS